MLQLILQIALFLSLPACKKNTQDNNTTNPIPTTPTDTATFFVKGADVSWVTEMESQGIKFYNSANNETECMHLLQSLGMNAIRLRVWVNPTDHWCDQHDLLIKAIRAKNLGMKILLDFHYSDIWADPGNQVKPALWNTASFNDLKDSVYQHTYRVMNVLKQNGITPEWVQVGNETNDGMLWPDGKASANMAAFTQLINKGYDAVKAVSNATQVIVHISNGYDNNLFRWIFDGLTSNGGKWDITGMSLYPSPADWQLKNNQCASNMAYMVSRYNKPVMICEVGMSWDQPGECKSFISDLMSKVKALPGKKGLGVFYWEPQAYNNWKGYTLGAFDNTGKPSSALDAFH